MNRLLSLWALWYHNEGLMLRGGWHINIAEYSTCSINTGLAKNNHGLHIGDTGVGWCVHVIAKHWFGTTPVQHLSNVWYLLSHLRRGPGAGIAVKHLQSRGNLRPSLLVLCRVWILFSVSQYWCHKFSIYRGVGIYFKPAQLVVGHIVYELFIVRHKCPFTLDDSISISDA